MMDPEDANAPTTRLLTLLNVSALKSKKRPREDPYPREKLNKRRCVNSTSTGPRPEPDPSELQNEVIFQPGDDLDTAEQELDESQGDQNDLVCEPLPHGIVSKKKLNECVSPQVHNPYDRHFGPHPEILTERSRAAADYGHWGSHGERIGKLNAVVSVLPEVSVLPQKKRVKKTAVRVFSNQFFSDVCDIHHVRFWNVCSILSRLARLSNQQVLSLQLFCYPSPYFGAEYTRIQDDLLSVLSAHLDFYHTSVTLEHHQYIREVITLHALDHVTK